MEGKQKTHRVVSAFVERTREQKIVIIIIYRELKQGKTRSLK